MIITHHTSQFFKITKGDLTIAINPVDKAIDKKVSSFGTDITLITTRHPQYYGVDTVTYGDKEPFVISGPGEYEAEGVFFKGIATKDMPEIDGKKYVNTVYSFTLDEIDVLFLGRLANKDLSGATMDEIREPHILFISLEGISSSDAGALAVKLSPAIVIPMDYGDEKSEVLQKFLKEMSAEGVEVQDKITLKKKDVDGKEGEVVVLSS
ncbi:MAG: hypothetical protein ACI9AR_000368 [Flavobacteriaceae bacterium]|jgi:hypothetical protein